MGNSATSTLKAAIINNNIGEVRAILGRPSGELLINELINRRGDTPLMFAASLGRTDLVKLLIESGADVNHVNVERFTALDLAIRSSLPPDGDILSRYRLDSEQSGAAQTEAQALGLPQVDIPEIIEVLLAEKGQGRTLERLILFVMRNEGLVRRVINSIDELHLRDKFRISGLLLQVSVWFDHLDNLRLLVYKGVNIEHFWTAPFMPRIEPSSPVSLLSSFYEDEDLEEDEYCLSTSQTSDPLQELKFLFIQEWWADWNDGENPGAQYRAGLHLTPECALFFVQTANRLSILEHIMEDIMQYLPPTCSGPNLQNMCLLNCLTMAGYVFHEEQEQHFRLKFNVDFEPHRRFNQQPRKLRHICRISMRFMFNTNVHLAVDGLPDLPRTLRNFLLLQDDIEL